MALGSPGGDNQDQTILQAFLDIVEFWPDWYPNLHEAFEWPRVQTLHFYGSFWPHNSGFNKLNVEANIPDAVYNALACARPRRRPHPGLRHERLRHGGADRSRQRQPDRRRGSAAGLLRDGVLSVFRSTGITRRVGKAKRAHAVRTHRWQTAWARREERAFAHPTSCIHDSS